MKISTKGEYGAVAMLALAMNWGKGPVDTRWIATQQGKSVKYLEQLMGVLQKAGLIRSLRGPKGGYELQKPPSEITLLNIIEALEGPVAPLECVDDSYRCNRSSQCVPRGIFVQLRDVITKLLSSVTLQDMCEQQQTKLLELQRSYVYYI